ncbi:hypothetical protein K435DRAFT_870970 [Dendrothele bispora CBS 962.96]|uniref:DUF6532 domain-containing protein n=1 Tax=Dendrothele bispora (strain CBS 962.96) TaxID=1314807 RepID=A0A4S8L5Q2_DENBC|nr:hypothetical protein K435DRAFT_870970 [Dendrothele bispora CBS 962.96]
MPNTRRGQPSSFDTETVETEVVQEPPRLERVSKGKAQDKWGITPKRTYTKRKQSLAGDDEDQGSEQPVAKKKKATSNSSQPKTASSRVTAQASKDSKHRKEKGRKESQPKRRYQAPDIDETDEESERSTSKSVSRSGSRSRRTISRKSTESFKQFQEDEQDSSSEDGEHVEMPENDNDFDPEERENDLAAADLFEDEAVIFVSRDKNVGGSRSSSRASSRPTSPPSSSDGGVSHASDDETSDSSEVHSHIPRGRKTGKPVIPQDLNDDWDDRVPVVDNLEDEISQIAPLPTKKAQKLQSELPQVSNKSLPTSRLKASRKSTPGPVINLADEEDNEPWLTRTNIIVHKQTERGKTYYFQMDGQNEHITKVMHKAFDIGKRLLFLSDNTDQCPVSPQGINVITLKALILSAEDCGFNGGYDIADRLENGDHRLYIDPLIRYAAHRIAMDRAEWKEKHVSLVLSAYGLGHDQKSRVAARDLSNSMQLHFGLKQDGTINPVNPFGHPGLIQFMTAAFFSHGSWFDIITKYKSLMFVSSVDSKSHELELPRSMVAISCAVIYTILQEHAYSKSEKFPPASLDVVWKYYMEKLELLAQTKLIYHKVMHNLYSAASHDSISAHGLSTQDIVDSIDWAALAVMEEAETPAEGQGLARV